MIGDRPWDAFVEAAWRTFEQGGWEYLLPSGRGKHWLCVDVLDGATSGYIASLCESLDTVCLDPARVADVHESLRLLGHHNVNTHAGSFPAAAADGKPFDGFVLHDLKGRLDDATRARCLAAGRAALAPDGFVFVTSRNRYSYLQILGREHSSGSAPSALLRILERTKVTQYPFICNPEGRLYEIVAPYGYVSVKNPTRWGEKLRLLVLGPKLARYLSPGFGFVELPQGAPPRMLDLVIEEAVARGVVAAGTTFRRWHVLRGGKVIVSLGAPGRGFGDVIVVFTRGQQAIERREREFTLLSNLAALPQAISRHIPRTHFRTDVAGTPAFLMEELRGITLDAPSPQLEAATRDAAAFITRLQVATSRASAFGEEDFIRLVEPWFARAEARYPPLANVLTRLRPALREALVAHQIPVVWMHGDYKVENVIVDAADAHMIGVIDWEHTEPEGLPLIDLWYLHLYNREIEAGTHFFPAVDILLGPGRMPADFRRASERYGATIGVPEVAWRGLAGALIAHHIGSRMYYLASDTVRMAQVRAAIEAWLAWRE